jgi:hypothetical protein
MFHVLCSVIPKCSWHLCFPENETYISTFTPGAYKKNTLTWECWYIPIILTTQEAEMGILGVMRLAWAKLL